MIISRCPLRISLAGGGSDLPKVSGMLNDKGKSIGFSVNWKMTLVGHPFYKGIVLKYSDIEIVKKPVEIKHRLFKEIICRLYPHLTQYEITSMCNVIGGTGLGSSSAFTISLINLLNFKQGKKINKKSLANMACTAEVEWAERNIGYQDQYLCALGGANMLLFDGCKSPIVEQISYNQSWNDLNNSPFVLYKIKGLHDSSKQLENHKKKIDSIERLTELVNPVKDAIISSNIEYLSELVGEGWKIKKNMCKDSIINAHVDSVIYSAKKIDSCASGKLLGSGGGGYILIITRYAQEVCNKLGEEASIISVDPDGSTVTYE